MECTKYYIMHVSASTFSHRGKSLPRILLPTVEYLYTRVPLYTTTVKTFSITGIGKIRLDTRPDGLILLYTCRYIMRVHAAWVRVERVRIILCVKKKKNSYLYSTYKQTRAPCRRNCVGDKSFGIQNRFRFTEHTRDLALPTVAHDTPPPLVLLIRIIRVYCGRSARDGNYVGGGLDYGRNEKNSLLYSLRGEHYKLPSTIWGSRRPLHAHVSLAVIKTD